MVVNYVIISKPIAIPVLAVFHVSVKCAYGCCYFCNSICCVCFFVCMRLYCMWWPLLCSLGSMNSCTTCVSCLYIWFYNNSAAGLHSPTELVHGPPQEPCLTLKKSPMCCLKDIFPIAITFIIMICFKRLAMKIRQLGLNIFLWKQVLEFLTDKLQQLHLKQ